MNKADFKYLVAGKFILNHPRSAPVNFGSFDSYLKGALEAYDYLMNETPPAPPILSPIEQASLVQVLKELSK